MRKIFCRTLLEINKLLALRAEITMRTEMFAYFAKCEKRR